MNQRPVIQFDSTAASSIQELGSEELNSLTLEELRELPHMLSLGFDVDAGQTAPRSAQ